MEHLHTGVLFEVGPDGYGYILDRTESGKSYAFHAGMLNELPAGTGAANLSELEGLRVTFTVARRRVESVALAAALGHHHAAGAE